tara:strand:+ start:3583 stop:4842 length:1260 start_codon:yes stop_codon:yes gene_type:complete
MYRRRSVGGNISSANGVIKSFQENGYEVDILSDDIVPGLEDKINEIKFIFFPHTYLRLFLTKLSFNKYTDVILSKVENYIFQKIMIKQVSKLFENGDYEHCYVRASPHVYVIDELIKKHKISLIVEVNKPLSMTPYNKDGAVNWPKDKKNVFIPKEEKIQYELAKMITVDSSLRAKWILDFVGDYKNKILINHNGVDPSKFSPHDRDYDTLNSYGFTASDIIVGMASSFRWYNDLEELFEIIKRTIEQNNKVKFLLISGDKKKAKHIYSLIQKDDLSNFVKLAVEIPFNEMPKVLNICDICLSHFNFNKKWPHNCSIKHLEYLALAKPVVATDVGEVNFAIEDGINGFLCREGDIHGYVNAIDRLAKSPYLRQKLGHAGSDKAISELTWNRNIERILRFILSLTEKDQSILKKETIRNI